MSDFNPNSTDAVLARILANQDEHTRILIETREQVKKTNGRVTQLEQDKWYTRGVTASIAVLAAGAWEAIKLRFH